MSAGVDLLTEGGYEAFTIAAVCERAAVPPRAIYARVDHKEALFLAVYEHGMRRVDDDMSEVFADLPASTESALLVMRTLVTRIADVFHRHEDFLKPLLLLSATHPEVHRRGSFYSRRLGEQFVATFQPAGRTESHPSTAASLQFCFAMVHSAVVMRTMYGPGFAVPESTHDSFADALSEAAVRYYLGNDTVR